MNLGNLKNVLANFTVNFHLPPVKPEDKKVPVVVKLTPNAAIRGMEQQVVAMVEPEHAVLLAYGLMKNALLVNGRSVVQDVLNLLERGGFKDAQLAILRAEQSLATAQDPSTEDDLPKGPIQ